MLSGAVAAALTGRSGGRGCVGTVLANGSASMRPAENSPSSLYPSRASLAIQLSLGKQRRDSPSSTTSRSKPTLKRKKEEEILCGRPRGRMVVTVTGASPPPPPQRMASRRRR
ncbi:hypothetical protein MTO96_048542 [Rhipicephalus appendiculatus]